MQCWIVSVWQSNNTLHQFTFSSAYNGEPFWSFTSIPYAEPPVGERRFRRPEHHNGWEGIRVSQAIPQCATVSKRRCQLGWKLCRKLEVFYLFRQHDNVMSGMSFGQEDCLYLSVHTRSSGNEGPSADHLLPVLLYIHGGGFTLGSAEESTMGPEIMMQENMVCLFLNKYLVGSHG